MSRAEDLLERIAILLGRSDEREEQKHDPGILKGREPDGWQGSTELVTGTVSPIVILSANFPKSGEYTIEFNLIANPGSNQPIQAVAMVKWSVEGSTVTRLLNIADGASISGVAQGVTVFAYDATVPVNGGEVSPVAYVVTAQVAKGVRGTNKQPPTLIPPNSLAGRVDVEPASTVLVPIPAGAGVISVYVTAGFIGSPEPDSNAIFVTQVFGAIPFTAKQYDPRDFPDWVPLAAGVDAIGLRNNSGAEVLFSVQFGIDG